MFLAIGGNVKLVIFRHGSNDITIIMKRIIQATLHSLSVHAVHVGSSWC